MNNVKRKFNVTNNYRKTEKPFSGVRKCAHTITERFENVRAADMSDLLIEVLDVPFTRVDGKRVVREPDISRLTSARVAFSLDKNWVKREFARQKKAKAVYDELMSFVDSPIFYGPKREMVDRNTEITVQMAS